MNESTDKKCQCTLCKKRELEATYHRPFTSHEARLGPWWWGFDAHPPTEDTPVWTWDDLSKMVDSSSDCFVSPRSVYVRMALDFKLTHSPILSP